MSILKNRLGRRIVTLMILASALLSLIAAAAQLYFSYRTDLSRVLGELEIVERSFLSGLENALWQFNFEQVDVLIDGIFAPNDIVAVDLISSTGHTFSRGETGAAPKVVESFDLIHVQPDGAEIEVGRLTVTLSLASVQRRLWTQFLALVASNFLKTLAASVIMLLIFERMVSRHLRKITDYVSGLDWDSQDQGLTLADRAAHIHDDLRNIVSALNDSRARLASSRKQAESLGLRMEAVLNAATSGIVAFDAEGRLAMVNPQAQHMLGVLAPDLPQPWPDEITFLDHENMATLDASSNPIERALAGQTLTNETSIMSRAARDRDPRYVRLSSATLKADEASNIRVVMVIDDVSEQEKNRQQVERASRLDALGQLTGGVAHDFNNLLATISYSMQLALIADTAEKRAQYIRTAMTSIDRGASLTKRLLAFAKKQPGVAEARSVSSVLEEFVALAGPTIEEMIDLQVTEATEELYVFCDTAQLENALLNLVINARDAILRSGKGGRIMLQARGVSEIEEDRILQREGRASHIASALDADPDVPTRSFRYVEFAVSDDGPGMDEEVRRRALDPFFTTKETNSGTGLGLSMVYGFVQQSDGQLRIHSEEGRGTTIRLLLPRGVASGQRETLMEIAAHPKGDGQTILVVEDEVHLAEILCDVIESFGYRAAHATKGQTAIDILKSDPNVVCLLTDIVIPGGIGGFDLASTARDLRPELPIIYMSGYTGFSRAEMGRVVGPMLAKPAAPGELAAALNAALSPGKTTL